MNLNFYKLNAVILLITLSCSQEKEGIDTLFTEKHRPQFHFTPPSQWMNDPNGMVYYEGEYHLFYQFYPDDNVWGPMHWGHAVSKDLIRWKHLPIALYPDSLGLIFSGSAVIDWKNSSGFGSEDNPPMLAIFTHHLMEGEKSGRSDFQYQSIAYSLDKGRTWTKYEGNPVIENPGIKDFRDPKVIWHEETQRWIMVFAAWDRIKFYTSSNLIDWEFTSDFGPNEGSPGRPWECPDLFPLTIEETGEEKWVLIVSVQSDAPNKGTGTSYFVGDFDGKTFTNAHPPDDIRWLDYGTDNYAFVTWSDVPDTDGRRIGVGWLSNWLYALIVPTYEWRSAMTLPRELNLVQSDDGYRIVHNVVEEFSKIRKEEKTLENIKGDRISLDDAMGPLDSLMDVTFEVAVADGLTFHLENDKNERVSIAFDDGMMSIDRTRSGLVDFYDDFAAIHTAPFTSGSETIRARLIVDLSSIEVFVNDGECVMTDLVFPTEPYNEIVIEANEGVQLQKVTYASIKSIWN